MAEVSNNLKRFGGTLGRLQFDFRTALGVAGNWLYSVSVPRLHIDKAREALDSFRRYIAGKGDVIAEKYSPMILLCRDMISDTEDLVEGLIDERGKK